MKRMYRRGEGTVEVTWNHHSVSTPNGEMIWATDGQSTWTIWGDGKPIPPEAKAVLAWALVVPNLPNILPKPPNDTSEDISDTPFVVGG